MDLQLTGKTALVTGGTRGIGRAIVEAFAAEGANVAFCARDAAEIADTEAALADSGVKVEGAILDVGDGDGVAAWVDDVADRFGGLDAVVSNVSALAIPDTAENWEASLRVDLMGTVRLMQAAIPQVRRSDSPSLVAISSVSGREVDFASGPYGTVKSALIAYMAGLAFQLADAGIRANTVSPGNTYFDGGVWQGIESGCSGDVHRVTGPEPHRPDGHAAGGGRRRRLRLQSACFADDRCECARGRRSVPRDPVLAPPTAAESKRPAHARGNAARRRTGRARSRPR